VKFLLDTCTFLWITQGSKELSSAAVQVFTDPKNEAYLSAISAWEINVKYLLGVIYQKTIITFAELTIIRFLMILGILPNSSGLLEKS
jgi:PIN domain nuclease of toxin-antitoxin system